VAETVPPAGASVEDWAHRVRLRALALTMREAGASRAAIGHTLDDQVETVLIALLRGGGLDAVAGLRPVHGPYVRPLIDVTRDEVNAFCRARHLRPRIDPTNRDVRLFRNAVRLRALPAIEDATRRDVRAPIARTSALLRRDAEELERRATEAMVEFLEEVPEGIRLDALALTSLPWAIGSRVARSAVYRCGVLPSADDVDAILDLSAGRPGRKRHLTGGLVAARRKEYVSLSRSSPESRG
jgi:tRNA(Ile)-lysidine synthase